MVCRMLHILVAVVAWLALHAAQPAAALFEDQAGTFDWYKPYIGHVTSAAFHRTKPRLYVSSQQGVAGVLNLRDGSIGFRHMLDPGAGAQSLLLDTPAVFVTLTASGALHAWDPVDGVLKWAAQLGDASSSSPSVSLAALPVKAGYIAALAGGQLQVCSGAQ